MESSSPSIAACHIAVRVSLILVNFCCYSSQLLQFWAASPAYSTQMRPVATDVTRSLVCLLGSRAGADPGVDIGGHMASAEREPIMGVWGCAPSGVQGQSPWSGGLRPLKLNAFWQWMKQHSYELFSVTEPWRLPARLYA